MYRDNEADVFLIQAVGRHDFEMVGKVVEIIKQYFDVPFSFIAVPIEDWNHELSPWEAPPVFGNDYFGSGARETLDFVADILIPELNKAYTHNAKIDYYLGGYSLSGLFALWTAYQTNISWKSFC